MGKILPAVFGKNCLLNWWPTDRGSFKGPFLPKSGGRKRNKRISSFTLKNCTVRTSPSSWASEPTPTDLSKFHQVGLKALNFLPTGYNFIFSQTNQFYKHIAKWMISIKLHGSKLSEGQRSGTYAKISQCIS